MARGYRIPDEKRAEFRSEFLRLGSVSQAAESTGLAIRTAWNFAQQCDRDPDFVKARARLRAGAIEATEMALADCLALAYERAHEKPLTPQELAQIAVDHGLKTFQFQDVRPQYVKAITDIHRALTNSRKKLDQDGNALREPPTVVIQLAQPPVASGEPAPGTDEQS
jgi:hypothetical protein